ncbi:MAG: chemotaxis protein CheX [Clostridia bacterium]|nr:chemotaxis protein CheX [Clostridia bacterium]
MFTQFYGQYLVKNSYLTNEQFLEIVEAEKTTRVKLGLIAVSEKMLTQAQADEINRLQARIDRRFGDIAIEKGYLTEEQVSILLGLQGNPYLSFVQTVVDKGFLTLQQLEEGLLQCKEKNGFTDDEMEAIKSGDVDLTSKVFIKILQPFYFDLFQLTLRNIVRFITPHIYMDKVYKTSKLDFEHLALQHSDGAHNICLGISGNGLSLLSIANPFAKERFEVIDDDSFDSVCEFINVINGLFASELSQSKVDIDMLPPVYYNQKSIKASDSFYVLPVYIKGSKVEIVIIVDTDYEII